MKKLILLFAIKICLSTVINAQNVSILPGESSNIEVTSSYSGDFGNSNTGSGFSCNYNVGRGLLSIGYEIQSDNYASWDIAHIAFWYNGGWKSIAWFDNSDNQTGCDYTTYNANHYSTPGPAACNQTSTGGGGNYEHLSGDMSYTKIGKMGGVYSDRYQNICMKNEGNLNVYHNNYLPQPGVILNRQKPTDNYMWGIQTAPYTLTGTRYPTFNDPNPATRKPTGYNEINYVQYGNLPGFIYNQFTGEIAVVIINIANLPPEMISSPKFKVHIYARSNSGNHNRIYETTYNNPNFMIDGPSSVVATDDMCDTVKVTWSNKSNALPDDGVVTIKNVIFRNGSYLGMVPESQTYYYDLTAAQDVEYDYSVMHVAFSETGETYYKSPESAKVQGSVLPSPNQPINPTASVDDCTGKININWGFNGVNPTYFRIDRSDTLNGTYTTLSSTIPGSSRSFIDSSSVTRGQNYFYRIYSINKCGVISTTYANTAGMSMADPGIATNVNATLNATFDTVYVTWTDVANNEDKYEVHRQDDQGNLVIFSVNKQPGSGSTITFKDGGITACRDYTYSIFSFNNCAQSGLQSAVDVSGVIPPPNLNTSFTSTKKLTCSKGYFNDRIELSWSNNNGQNIDIFKIYRKILGSTIDSVLVGTANQGSGFYVDNTADAGVFYKYTIVGVKYCNGTDILTNASEDIGFRSPTGIVNGHIEYNGGVSVPNVKVTVEPVSAAVGNAVLLNGTNSIDIANNTVNIGIGDTVSVEAWAKSTAATPLNQKVAYKNGTYDLYLDYTANTVNFSITLSTGTKTVSYPFTNGVTQTQTATIQQDSSRVVMSAPSSFVAGDYIRFGTTDSDPVFAVDSVKGGGVYVYIKGTFPNATYSGVVQKLTKSQALAGNISLNGFYHYCGAYDGSYVKLFVNGIAVDSVAATGNITHSTNPLQFGKNWVGAIDEMRVWNKSRSNNEIKRDHSIMKNGDEGGIIVLLHADEGATQYVFDISKTSSTFNENHGVFNPVSSASWTNIIPTKSQMSYAGYTDTNGDYTVSGVRYTGNGANYKVTPYLNLGGVHQFTPGNKVLFLGDGANIQNGIDFIDESSFRVQGNVRYYGTSCPAKDVMLYVDGEPLISSGQVEMSDASGNFDIQVPIGNHFITAVKNGHTFSAGRFPPTGTYDFQQDLTGMQFVDSTFQIVTGRVVGGTTEEAKPHILGRSKNNIGQADIIFQTLTGCYADTVRTADSTGEFTILLPPMKYSVPDFTIISNPAVAFTNNALLDVSMNIPLQTEYDTVFIGTAIDHIDSAKYHKVLDFIYRSTPQIFVTNADSTGPIESDTSITYIDKAINDTVVVNLNNTPFPYDVYSQHHIYQARIYCFEQYVNKDGGSGTPSAWVYDNVSVLGGDLTITNNISSNPVETISLTSGDTLYEFKAGQPSTSFNASDGDKNFTKSFNIQLTTPSATVNWYPGGAYYPGYNGISDVYLGYVQGGKSADGQAYTSRGPQVVTHILRDPPGSESFAYLEAGSSITRTESWEMNETVSADLNKNISLGTEFTVGLGVQTPTKLENDLTLNTEIETGFNEFGEKEETITINETWQTNAAPEQVGAGSDLFVGRTMNSNFGVAYTIGMVDTATCGMQGVDCIPSTVTHSNGKVYQLAKRKSLWMVPGGYNTMFMYDQNAIINYIIPDLEALRNQVFINEPGLYTLNFTDINDPKYGTNNDDPIWGTSRTSTTVEKTEPTLDYDGPSYTYNWNGTKPDTIRWFNQQIRLWKEAIAMNEKLKYEAELKDNFSANGGVTYDKNVTVEKIKTTGFAFEASISETATLEISAKVGGAGVGVEQGLSLAVGGGTSSSESQTNTTTYGYTFYDPDQGDFHSVDVKDAHDGWGPVFSIQAGKTSCPYEGLAMSQFYKDNSGNPVQLSGGTLQIEIPEIEVEGSKFAKKVNIPADQKAVFNLRLINSSATGDDIIYTLTVLGGTNPDGAQLSVDGFEASGKEFMVPGGSSINKTLEVAKGPIAFEYDSIAILLRSSCQFAFGTSDEEDIADTCYISVHYLPTCTKPTITQPLDQWVVNNSFNDTLDLIFQGYDINYYGYDNLTFEFKPSAQASWIPLQTWYMDTTGMGGELPLSQVNPYTWYEWSLLGMGDGPYDIRAKTECSYTGMPPVSEYSDIYVGVVDRINPHPFGNPQPADGILSPNDEIMIQFNEPVDLGQISTYNFDIRGVLNGADIRHDASLYFDGVNDNVRIANGINLKGSSTVEMYVKRNQSGVNEVIFSQGINASQKFEIGFNTSDQVTVSIADQNFNTTSATGVIINDGNWHHLAVSYDNATNVVEVFIDGALEGNGSMYADYTEGGDIYLGKSASSTSTFNGNIHELRIWNKTTTQSDLVARMNITLSGQEFGLVGVWPMDEAIGLVANDKSRSRHGIIDGANWQAFPSGQVVDLDGVNSYLEYNTSQMAFSTEMDLTIEFWYNANTQADSACLFSNGKGDDNLTWAIYTDPTGKIFLKNNGQNIEAVSSNTFDGSWHHFAMIVRRASTTSFYVDGNLTNSVPSSSLGEFGSPKSFIGSRGYYVGSVLNNDQYFTGKIDEVRIWNLSRKQEQISRDMVNRLNGDEYGLQLYLPFEKYADVLGVPTLTTALNNIVDDSLAVAMGGASLTGVNVPNIKLPRPVSSIPFTFSVNSDKIIITPNIAAAQIENVTLDITTEKISDLHGNLMQSPKTWIAYVDKNQVVWEDLNIDIAINLDSTYSFNEKILNIGGQLKQYTISNLPSWLTVNQTTGSVSPNSFDEVTFEVVQGTNIGTYEQDIYLTTDFGYDEKLNVKLKVTKPSPNWNVDPSAYQYSMSIIGQLRIDSIISIDPEDKLVALVNGEVRGVTNLQYYSQYDAYLAFLDVYSNVVGGDTVDFYIWDASVGKTHIEVTPELIFQDNTLYGTPSAPQIFDAVNIISQPIVLSQGWNWVSFNLNSVNQSDVNKLMRGVNSGDGDIVKSMTTYDQNSTSIGWVGGLTAAGGVNNKETYKIYASNADTIDYYGSKINPSDVKIPIDSGWNWIGFVALKNVSVADAFGNYNPLQGDLLKGQSSFAIYDTILGWVGNLTFMKPNSGYMYKSSKVDTLVYPNSAVFTARLGGIDAQETLNANFGLYPEDFENNMNAIFTIDACAKNYVNNTLVAYVDGEIRGVTLLEEGLNFITIHGNSFNEKITFAILDDYGQSTHVVENINFMPQGVEGRLSTPIVLHTNQPKEDCDNYVTIIEPENDQEISTEVGISEVKITPTVFAESFTVQYYLEEAGVVSIELYDITGRFVGNLKYQQENPGFSTVTWSEDRTGALANGQYFVKIKLGNQSEITQKIIKVNN